MKKFLPTLAHRLYASDEPFLKFTCDSTAFLEAVQEIKDAIYPDIDYEVKKKGPILVTV